MSDAAVRSALVALALMDLTFALIRRRGRSAAVGSGGPSSVHEEMHKTIYDASRYLRSISSVSARLEKIAKDEVGLFLNAPGANKANFSIAPPAAPVCSTDTALRFIAWHKTARCAATTFRRSPIHQVAFPAVGLVAVEPGVVAGSSLVPYTAVAIVAGWIDFMRVIAEHRPANRIAVGVGLMFVPAATA